MECGAKWMQEVFLVVVFFFVFFNRYLSVSVLVVLIIAGVIVLLDEAKVLLPLPLQHAVSPLRVGGEITLKKTKGRTKKKTALQKWNISRCFQTPYVWLRRNNCEPNRDKSRRRDIRIESVYLRPSFRQKYCVCVGWGGLYTPNTGEGRGNHLNLLL